MNTNKLPFAAKEHSLKCEKNYFDRVLDGSKRFELRRNDRDFQKGDILILRETIDNAETGRKIKCTVSYVLAGYPGLKKGFAVLSILNVVLIEE